MAHWEAEASPVSRPLRATTREPFKTTTEKEKGFLDREERKYRRCVAQATRSTREAVIPQGEKYPGCPGGRPSRVCVRWSCGFWSFPVLGAGVCFPLPWPLPFVAAAPVFLVSGSCAGFPKRKGDVPGTDPVVFARSGIFQT